MTLLRASSEPANHDVATTAQGSEAVILQLLQDEPYDIHVPGNIAHSISDYTTEGYRYEGLQSLSQCIVYALLMWYRTGL